jgi:hypothetical protein
LLKGEDFFSSCAWPARIEMELWKLAEVRMGEFWNRCPIPMFAPSKPAKPYHYPCLLAALVSDDQQTEDRPSHFSVLGAIES